MIFHPNPKTLSKYADDGLAESKRLKVSNHLHNCAYCQKKMRSIEAMKTALTSGRKLDPEFTEQIISGLKDVKRVTAPDFALVLEVIGRVIIWNDERGEEIVAYPGMSIKLGDTILTNEQAKALIRLNDGSNLYINKETKMQFQKEKYPIHLYLGQFFAMMKPQPEVFKIHTPSAVLGVIGTDFDTEVRKDDTTVLTVLKGAVSLQNESGQIIVGKKRRAEAGKQSNPTMSKIKNPRSVSSWTKSFESESNRGTSLMRKMSLGGLFVALIIAALFLLSYFQHLGPFSPTEGKLNKKTPFSFESPYASKGLSWRTSADAVSFKQGKPYKGNFATLTQIVDFNENDGSTIQVLIEKFEGEFLQDPLEREAVGKFIGRRFEYQLAPDGNVHSITAADGQPVNGFDMLNFAQIVGTSTFSNAYLKKNIVPGQKWASSFNTTLPVPNAYIKSENEIEFQGYSMQDGKEMATFSEANYTTIFGGFSIIEVSPEPNVKVNVSLVSISIEGTGKYSVDVNSGRVTKTEKSGKSFGQEMLIKTEISGKPPLEERRRANEANEFNCTCIIEYL